jgi:hypothetical protein
LADKNVKKPRVQSIENSLGGVVKIAGQSQLPQEFITIGKSFEEALGRCVLRDDAQKNAVIIYKAQLELFEMWDEIQDLTNWLNASAAVGGFNRSLAAMTYTQIYVPEGAGIKVSKENQKALMEMQKQRNISKGNRDNNNGDNSDNRNK